MSIGIWQIILIVAVMLLLFGAGKLPKIMGDFAKGIKIFKSTMNEENGSTNQTQEASKE